MNCEEMKSLLDSFAACELGSPQKEMVEEHLKTCEACRKELSAMRETIRLLSEWGEVDEPFDFVHQVRQRIETPRRHSVFARLISQPAMAKVLASAACVALAAFGFWFAYQQLSPPPTPRVARHETEAPVKPKSLARAPTESRALVPETAEELLPPALPKARRSSAGRESEKEEWYYDVEGKRESHGIRGETVAADRVADDFPTGHVERDASAESGETDSRKAEPAAGATVAKPPVVAAEPVILRYALEREKKASEAEGDATTTPEVALLGKGVDESGTAFRRGSDAKSGRTGTEEGQSQDMGELASRPADSESTAVRARYTASRPPGLGISDVPAGEGTDSPGEKELQMKPAGGPITPTEGAERERKRGAGGEEGLEKAGEKMLSSEQMQQEAAKGLELLRTQSGFSWDENGRLRLLNGATQVQERATGRPDPARHDLDGDTDLPAEYVAGLQRSYAVRGTFPELVLTVRDRAQALAEIQKIVTDLGGSTHPRANENAGFTQGQGTPVADFVVVQLKAEAYEKLKEKLAAHRALREFAYGGSGLLGAAKEARAKMEAQGIVTFLIRLVEVPQANEPQPLRDE